MAYAKAQMQTAAPSAMSVSPAQVPSVGMKNTPMPMSTAAVRNASPVGLC